MTSMTTDLADRLGDRESITLEFKQSAADLKKIGRAICAFADDLGGTGGGDLLIGVDDKGRPVADVKAEDEDLRKLTEFRGRGFGQAHHGGAR